ncbi:MAG: ParB N-terminal domain-containing protein [Sulfolobales archaeon]
MKGIIIKIAYSDLDSLRPHEESIEERIRYVETSISNTGILRRPLIADEKTGVLIDGTHRYNALKRMGVSIAPVIYVDYLSEDEIKVSRWIRMYIFKNIEKTIIERISEHFYSFSYEPLTKIIKDSYIIELVGKQPANAYRAISQIEKDKNILSSLKAILFRTNIDPRSLEKRCLVIIPPYLSKEDVIEAGLAGRPFPPKSTRHITILKKIELHMRIKYLFSNQ